MAEPWAELPERAPKRWFTCFTYEAGLRIETVAEGETEALQAAFAHLSAGGHGEVKVGYRSFRSRIIAYGEDDLRQLMRQIS